VFQLKTDVQRAAMVTHGLVEGQARAGTLFTQNPRLVGQLFHGRAAAFGQRMLRRAEHHQLILDPTLHFDVGVAAIAFNQTQINFVMRDLLHDIGSVLHVQLDLTFRVSLHEAADQQGGQIVANGQRRPH